MFVTYRFADSDYRTAIVTKVNPDGTLNLHVFDPGNRADRNILNAKEGTAVGRFSVGASAMFGQNAVDAVKRELDV